MRQYLAIVHTFTFQVCLASPLLLAAGLLSCLASSTLKRFIAQLAASGSHNPKVVSSILARRIYLTFTFFLVVSFLVFLFVVYMIVRSLCMVVHFVWLAFHICWDLTLLLHNKIDGLVLKFSICISGLVVEYIVAIDVPRVQFPADAFGR